MSIEKVAEFLDRKKAALGTAEKGSAEEGALSIIALNMEDGLTGNSALGELRPPSKKKSGC